MGDDDAVRRQKGLVRAALLLASELSLPAVLQKIADLAAEVAEAQYAALGVIGPDGRILEFITQGVTEEQRRLIGRLPEGHGILGALITEAKPLRLERIQDDPRSIGFPPNHPPMHSFLGVPIAVRGRVFGNLYLTEKRNRAGFTREDEETIVAFGAQAAVAIEYAHAQEELRRLALVEDRERIAKELHDDVIQSLFAVGMALQGSLDMVHDPHVMESRIAQSVEHIDRVIRDLRNYIFALRPGAAADRQLERSLRDLADGFREASGVLIEVDADPLAVSRLAGRATDVVQAAREAISNAVRHSKGRTVRVSLLAAGEEAVLEIADDGIGFDVAAAEGRGDGLGNLRSRAAALRGSMEIESEPGRGTWVRMTIPM